MNLEIENMEIVNLTEIINYIRSESDENSLLSIMNSLQTNVSMNTVSALQAQVLMGEIRKRVQYIKSINGFLNSAPTPPSNSRKVHRLLPANSTSNKKGIISITFLVASILSTLAMYGLIAISQLFK